VGLALAAPLAQRTRSVTNPVAISLIERGQRAVRLDTLRRLCIALRVQPADLVPTVTFKK
jgi:DNA-binding Xre family transcriptional regulator